MIDKIQKELFLLSDIKYKGFQCSLMPTVDAQYVIGIRMPVLRQYSKELIKNGYADDFIKQLPHKYYEENNLHGLIICTTKDFDKAIYELDRFLPHIDNWATCDLIDLKIFEKHKYELLEKIAEWTASDDTYTVRFGIKMLMSHFLDKDFKAEYLTLVADIHSKEYYVNMMRAWYFATALAKQYGETVRLFEDGSMDTWTHNKAIQKAIESYRVSDGHKAYLRALKRKEKGIAR